MDPVCVSFKMDIMPTLPTTQPISVSIHALTFWLLDNTTEITSQKHVYSLAQLSVVRLIGD